MQEKKTISEKIISYLEEHKKTQIAIVLLFFSTTVILSKLADNIDSINVNNLKIISTNSFVVFSSIVVLSIFIYAIVNIFFDRSNQQKLSNELKAKMQIVEDMLSHKGLHAIRTNSEVGEIEKQSDEIIIISENLLLDISNTLVDENYFHNIDKSSIGKFYPTVHENIKNGKQYTYYLKYDNLTHTAINLHMESHYEALKEKNTSIKEPKFILIPSTEFNFFSDVYIYKKGNTTESYEWLPSLTKESPKDENINKNNIVKVGEVLFYLKFSPEQTKKLDHILTTLKSTYGVTLGSHLKSEGHYIVNDEIISQIEKESTHIRIITESLKDDIYGGIFFESVKENLIKNKEYIYYLPDDFETFESVKEFKKDHKIDPLNTQVTFYHLPDNMFFFFSSIYIYDNAQAFELIPNSKMYFKYDKMQLTKFLRKLKYIESQMNKN